MELRSLSPVLGRSIPVSRNVRGCVKHSDAGGALRSGRNPSRSQRHVPTSPTVAGPALERPVRRFLDVVVISEVAGVRKPDPRIFATALTQLGVDPANAAYVGDNPEVDVIGAKRSGLLAVWKRDNFWVEPTAADWIIDDLAQLPPLALTRR